MERVVILFMVLAIPIVAIIGGITAGIFKTRGQQRMAELAQRERIAAIEKGFDPSKLLPLPAVGDDLSVTYLSPRQAALRRAQGLLIGGLIVLSAGIGLSLMLFLLPEPDARQAWAVGLLPFFVGLALLVSASVVRKGAPADDGGSQH